MGDVLKDRTGSTSSGSESQARAVLLSLLLEHPGKAGTGINWGTSFQEATKGRKPLTQAGSWRMAGTKQSD